MNWEDLINAAAESAEPVRADVPVRSTLDTRYRKDSLYRLTTAGGLWKAEADADGITLRRLFSGEEFRFTVDGWRSACLNGRIREVAE